MTKYYWLYEILADMTQKIGEAHHGVTDLGFSILGIKSTQGFRHFSKPQEKK